jgi:exopolyphosphatase / guanosine-5'-triphosphate,3'-diphosphate pyrophosphatase
MVSHHDHHRHSAYLVAHVDAAGFSQSQQRHLAELVLAQRGGLRKVATSLNRDAFAWQALCLRLAALLCHARTDLRAGAVKLKSRGLQAQLRVDAPWAADHPRAIHLLREEASLWTRDHAPLRLTVS